MYIYIYYRHSRFGGTFVVKNQRSISGNDRVYHRPITGIYIQSVLGYIHFKLGHPGIRTPVIRTSEHLNQDNKNSNQDSLKQIRTPAAIPNKNILPFLLFLPPSSFPPSHVRTEHPLLRCGEEATKNQQEQASCCGLTSRQTVYIQYKVWRQITTIFEYC